MNIKQEGDVTFDIGNLAAETNYILYAVVQDSSLNTSET